MFPRWTSAVMGSPRFSRALPPSATMTRISASYRCDQNGFDGVHAIFRLIEDDGGLRFKNLFRYLQGFDAILLEDLLADLGLPVMEGRQAAHELRMGIAGGRHDFGGDAVGCQQLDALLPHGIRLAH